MVRVSEQTQDLYNEDAYNSILCISDLLFYHQISSDGFPSKWTAADYLPRHSPSQADVATLKALSGPPDAAKYPHIARWYKHINSFEEEFPTLPGDASKPYTVYGPDVAEVTLNPAKAPAAEEDDDDVDLFGSDEEEDPEAVRIREERLAAYKEKKAAKPKVTAKSLVTMDIKPWGTLFHLSLPWRSTANLI